MAAALYLITKLLDAPGAIVALGNVVMSNWLAFAPVIVVLLMVRFAEPVFWMVKVLEVVIPR